MAINVHFVLDSGNELILEPIFECEGAYKDDPDDKFCWWALIRDLFLYAQAGEPSKCDNEFAAGFLFRKDFFEFIVKEKPLEINGERPRGEYLWVHPDDNLIDDTINLIVPISKIEYFFIKKIC